MLFRCYWHVRPIATFCEISKLPEIDIYMSTNCPAVIDTELVDEHEVEFPLIEQDIEELLRVKLLPVRSVTTSETPVPGELSTATAILVIEHDVGTMDIRFADSVVLTLDFVTLK
jgi:hypothetical protein